MRTGNSKTVSVSSVHMYIQHRSNIPGHYRAQGKFVFMATLEHTAMCHIQVGCFISLLPHHTFCVCSTKYDKAGPKIGG